MKTALIIVGHGSKRKDFDGAMIRARKGLQKDKAYAVVKCAYLEINEPSIPKAIEFCVKKGMHEILVLPYFLLSGRHVEEHIPQIVREARERFKGKAKIKLCPHLGYHEKLVEVIKERAKQARG